MRVILLGLGSVLMNTLEFRLRKFGCRVSKAQDGREALANIHAGHADILVTSVDIQNFRLTTFIKLIREDFSNPMPIILVSEPDGDLETVMKGIEAGADDFVTFPFKPIELVLRIKLLLHRQEYYFS